MKELEYPFCGEEIIKKKKLYKRELLNTKNEFLTKNIAILGGSTTNDVKNILELFLLNYGIRPNFYESEYNQYFEDAMFPNKKLEDFKPDVIYFHTSNRNISYVPSLGDDAVQIADLLRQEYSRFERMWVEIEQRYHCPIIQNNFEMPYFRLMGNKDASDIHGKINYITRLNLKFYEYAQTHDNFFINDINYESAAYGLEKWADPFYWHMYKYALCVPAIPYLSFNIANIVKSLYGMNKKGFVLDLDNTLWGGVIGDDGADNIEIGQETSLGQTYSEFQEYIKLHKQLGILLAINSKNDIDNALSGLKHPDTILSEEDFVIIKANWEPKDKNFREIASELNLLPESLVFVDDNPAEREIVRSQIPGISAPDMDNVEHYIEIIDKSGFFEVTNLSDDDLKRNDMYKANTERAKTESAYANYEDYLHSLNMKATIKGFEPIYMSRISQLTNKSNQFNLTTKRYNQSEIEEVTSNKTYITLYGKLEDKFGDNGVVSVVIGRILKDELHIDLWIMSCRVLKRDMEYAMMDDLVIQCKEKSITKIVGYYFPTAKNGMVKEFYGLHGFIKVSEDADGNTVWEYVISEKYVQKNRVISVNE